MKVIQKGTIKDTPKNGQFMIILEKSPAETGLFFYADLIPTISTVSCILRVNGKDVINNGSGRICESEIVTYRYIIVKVPGEVRPMYVDLERPDSHPVSQFHSTRPERRFDTAEKPGK